VQLNNIIDEDDVFLAFNPHENDTEDIAEDVNPDMYDKHHSKLWNEAVNKKALELEMILKLKRT